MHVVTTITPKISNTACMFSITRLLDQFNDANTSKFRQLLIKELNYDNETQLLCKILPLLHKSMTNESLQVLKHETMKLAQQQPSKYDKTMSVTKQIQQKYKDRLSNLHSDIIDYFGTFLDKKQSIEIGYLNKQLYIETQKQSYLLKRLNDPPLVVTETAVDKLFAKETNLFAYSLPRHLHLKLYDEKQQQLHDSQWYKKNAFSILNSFTCQYTVNQCLAAIPVEQFFCQKRNRNLNHFAQQHVQEQRTNGYAQARSPQIKKFECIASLWNKEAITTFCNNFNNYFVHNCKNDVNNIRNIEQLTVENKTFIVEGMHMTQSLLLTLGQISKKIKMENCALYFDNINDLKRIFHSNLKALEYDSYTIAKINNNNNNDGNKFNSNVKMHFDVTDLEISIIVHEAWDYVNPKRSLFSTIIKQLRLQGKVQCLKISFMREKEIRNNLRSIVFDVFNIARDTDTDTHNNTGMNETIMIIIHEEETLYTFAEILALFNDHRLRILDSAINNVQKIMFQFCLTKVYGEPIKPGDWGGTMWSYQSDTKYPIDTNKIECKNCDLEKKELGVLYQNVITWFQNIQNKYGNDKLEEHFYLHLTFNKI